MPDENDAIRPQADWNPPAGDEDFNSLFGGDDVEGRQHATPQTAEPTTASEPEVEAPQSATVEPEPQAHTSQPTPPQEDQFFLKTATGTVYKAKDEVVRGIEEKDRVIDDLRRKVAALAGIDPLRKDGQPQTTERTSYLNDPTRYAKDLTDYATNKQYDKYLGTQIQAFDEYLQSRYGHLLPKMEKLGRQDAIEGVVSEIPAFKTFYGSEDYSKALERHPRLKEAIQTAESRPDLQADYLPDLYKTVWDVSVALRAPDLANKGNNSPQPNPTPRMPNQSRTMPAPPVGGQTQKPGLNTSAGRKALMEELEAKGIKDFAF